MRPDPVYRLKVFGGPRHGTWAHVKYSGSHVNLPYFIESEQRFLTIAQPVAGEVRWAEYHFVLVYDGERRRRGLVLMEPGSLAAYSLEETSADACWISEERYAAMAG